MDLLLDRARELGAMVQGRTRRDLNTDRLFQLAVTRLIGVIGEIAREGVGGYRRDPGIVWPDVLRDYDTVDSDVIWELATRESPKLIAALQGAAPEHQS